MKCYSQAIAAAEHDKTLFANRSAAYLGLFMHEDAIQDAAKSVQLDSSWPKGHYRSHAHHYLLQLKPVKHLLH